jgi:hypothetical protein
MRHLNRYSYAYDNPYAFTDPDGRCPTCLIGAGIGALVGAGIELYKQTGGGKDWHHINGRAVFVETVRGGVVGGLAGAGAFGAGALVSSAGASTVAVATAEVAGGAYATGVGTFATGPASDLAKGQPEKGYRAYGKDALKAAAGATAGGAAGKMVGGALSRTAAPAAAVGVAVHATEEATSAAVSNSLQSDKEQKIDNRLH